MWAMVWRSRVGRASGRRHGSTRDGPTRARHSAGPDVADAVTAYVTGGDPRGCAPDEIVAARDLPIAAIALQGDLERLVAHDTPARWGIGRGALYTRGAPSTDRSLAPRADAAT